MEISVKLPNSLYEGVSNLAKTKKKSVGEIIKNSLKTTLAQEAETLARPLVGCSDAEVLAIANLKMAKKENKRMSELLYKNQADTLTPLERNEMESMVFVYQVGNLRKSQGIAEAVLRGLIKSPEDLK